MNLFKFISESGEEFISAKNKKEAIEEYCRENGFTKDWVKKNCDIINLGREEY